MTKQEAIAVGDTILKQMETPGWKLEVWENHGGWHLCLVNELCAMSLHPVLNLDNTYSYWCADAGYDNVETSHGFCAWNASTCYANPNEAVNAMIAYVMPIYQKWVRGAENLRKLTNTRNLHKISDLD